MTTEDRAASAEVADAAGNDIRGLMRTTRERVAEVLLATERAATDVVEAANADAEKIVRETHASATRLADERMAKIGSVFDAVAQKASSLDAELDGLRELVDRSLAELGRDLGVETEPLQAKLEPSEPVDEPANEPQEQPEAATDAEATDERPDAAIQSDRDRSDAVKLLAAQLIATGHSPAEAGERLVNEFGVEDPSYALAEYKSKRFKRGRRNGRISALRGS